jgi:DNA-binding LytR/AlgR family response regulator
MNGFELARRVHDQWPDVARLLVTGYAGTDTSGTDLEDVAVLPKPFAGDDLVRAANDALSADQGSKR